MSRLWFLLAIACTGDPVVDDDTPVDSGVEVDTEVVVPSTEPIDPARIVVVTYFGYDPAVDGAVSVDLGDELRPPSAFVIVASDTWNGSLVDDANACTVRITGPATLARASWLPEEALFGLDLVGVSVEDACAGRVVGVPDVGARLGGRTWSAAILPTLEESYRERLVAEGMTDGQLAFRIGGLFEGLPGGTTREAASVAWRVSERFRVEKDHHGAPVPMFADQLTVEGVLEAGYYAVQTELAGDNAAALLK